MSFSTETKYETSKAIPKTECCRTSLLYGMLFCDFKNGDGIIPTPVDILFSKLKKVQKDLSELEKLAENGDVMPVMKCAECKWAFMKGAFLACGTVTNPQKGYHLEFLLGDEKKARSLCEYLTVLSVYAAVIRRGHGFGVYIKNSETIVDFFGHIGASRSAFSLLDTKMLSEIRNEANRVSNCETANIKRTVDASSAQMRAIEKIMADGTQNELPDALKETFDLRAAFPDCSLSELALMHNPPITRSGVNHRLQRIIDFSNKRN